MITSFFSEMGYGTGSQKFPIAHDFLVLLERKQ